LPGNSTNARRLWNIAAAVLLAKVLGTWLHSLGATTHNPLAFDDSYMFARYAMNIRHGLGMSWNLDGVHTYGPTSLLWAAVVLVLSYLPMNTWTMLVVGSWLCSIGAIVAMAWAVASNAKSGMLKSTWRVLPLIALPLADTAVFTGNQSTGMETMLAMMLNALYLGLALGWARGRIRPELVGVVGILCFLARPESAPAVLMLPVLLYFLLSSPSTTLRGVLSLLGIVVAGIALDLIACKAYFHTALPLSFYMKSRHGYEGYPQLWHPTLLLFAFLSACSLYLAALILLGRKQDWRLIVSCTLPALTVFAYLGLVTQIMGFNSRYYAPYLIYFILPALLVIDRWTLSSERAETDTMMRRSFLNRGIITAAMMLFFVSLSSEAVIAKIRKLGHNTWFEYDPPQLSIAAQGPLPSVFWDQTMMQVTDLLMAPLPKGATVAATEVGYLGDHTPQLNVIDLAGLNDTQIALHGFAMNALLARKPDILWMPHTDYTYQRGVMFSDPALLAQYDVYAGAANYGLALRKDSPYRAQIDKQMQLYWKTAYPGYNMSDYLVRSASWTGQKHIVVGE
jgi:hypothetical protein